MRDLNATDEGAVAADGSPGRTVDTGLASRASEPISWTGDGSKKLEVAAAVAEGAAAATAVFIPAAGRTGASVAGSLLDGEVEAKSASEESAVVAR
jgi:hypothetical protein